MSTNSTQTLITFTQPPDDDPGRGVDAPHGGGKQDKGAPLRERANSNQDAAHVESARAHFFEPLTVNTSIPRTKKRSTKRQLVPVTIWVKRPIRSELERLAKQEGLSISTTGATLLEHALRQQLHSQQQALLQPLIEQAIRDQMNRQSARLASLLVRVIFNTGQTRRLVTNILGRQSGVNAEILDTILDASAEGAKKDLVRRSPQLSSLIEQEVKSWLDEETT